jgi:hypothetical protein
VWQKWGKKALRADRRQTLPYPDYGRVARHPPGIGLRHYLANGKTIIKAEHAFVGLFHFADRRE